MGTWGPGNFEDDDALDVLAFFQSEVIGSSIEKQLFRSDLPIDWLTIQRVMAEISISLALAEHCGGSIPERLDEWCKKVLETYDGFPRSTERDERFRKERRRVIVETFDRFAALRKP